MTTPTFNKFKSTTVYGVFNNLDYEDNSVQASSNIQRNLTVGGDIVVATGNIKGKKLFYDNVDISSMFISNTSLTTTLNSYANLGNASFYGSLTAVTPITSDVSSKVATTSFVSNKLSASLTSYANISGATFTGPLRATTQASTDNTTLVATTAYVKSQNYITSNPDLSTYALLSGATFSGTVNLNNGFTTPTGKDVFIGCNNAFPTSNSGGKTGLGFYWNQSGGRGEVNLLCYGQGGLGGMSIWNSNVSNAPTKLVEFYPDGSTFENDVTMKQRLNVKNVLNITQPSSTTSPILQFVNDIGQARALIYPSVGDSVLRFSILPQYGTTGYEWENGSNGNILMQLDINGNLTTKGSIILNNGTYQSTIQLSGPNLNIVPPTGGTAYIQSGLTLAGDGILYCTSVNCGNVKCSTLLDSNGYTGLVGQIPTANGGGGWGWLNPTTTTTNSVFGTQQILK